MDRIPKSDNLPDRPPPFFPFRDNRRRPRATPAWETSPPSRCSDTLRLPESEIAGEVRPSTLLRLLRRARHLESREACGADHLGKNLKSAALRPQPLRRSLIKIRDDPPLNPPQVFLSAESMRFSSQGQLFVGAPYLARA